MTCQNNEAASKNRFDTSPGNKNGWRPRSEWSDEEDKKCVELIATFALGHRSDIYSDEQLKAWSWNSGDVVNKKLQQILIKLCKEYNTDMPGPIAGRSPRKRASNAPEDQTSVTGSPKKVKAQKKNIQKDDKSSTTAQKPIAARAKTKEWQPLPPTQQEARARMLYESQTTWGNETDELEDD